MLQVVRIVFHTIRLRTEDYIFVLNGSSSTSPTLVGGHFDFTGDIGVYTTQQYMYVAFLSRGTSGYYGFNATVYSELGLNTLCKVSFSFIIAFNYSC